MARDLLLLDPQPAVRHLLLRDVLGKAHDSPEAREARTSLGRSGSVMDLAAAQKRDGGWGAFHSAGGRTGRGIATTEAGVERALALGLDPAHPILLKASAHILDLLNGKMPFPDRLEKNDRWDTGVRLFAASTLSLIRPGHHALDYDRSLWGEIARRAFQSGTYREEDEINAHARLTGATVRSSYLVLNGKYQLNILGSVPGTLSGELESALLTWIWDRPHGIGYLSMPLRSIPPDAPGQIDRWLASLELLSRCFPGWCRLAGPQVEWLWGCRDDRGFWDFGPGPSTGPRMPISDNWRKRRDRIFDWTTRVLILLSRYHEADSGK